MDPCHRKTFTIVFLKLLLISTIGFAVAEQQSKVESMVMQVYRDGLAHVTQRLTVDNLIPKIDVPLLSSTVENLIVLDENQLAVDYQQNANNLTVFNLGASNILIEYDTITLTGKDADMWTLIMDSPYNLTVSLPRNSTIVYLNQVPTAIDTTNDALSLSLHPSQWEISYILPLQQEDQDENSHLIGVSVEYLITTVVAASAMVVLLLFFVWRRRKINVKKILSHNPSLIKEDVAVIEFLAEKDGKAFESEIRAKFPDMPRTSLWRLVRRLVRLEIVEVKKIGLENQVQLKK